MITRKGIEVLLPMANEIKYALQNGMEYEIGEKIKNAFLEAAELGYDDEFLLESAAAFDSALNNGYIRDLLTVVLHGIELLVDNIFVGLEINEDSTQYILVLTLSFDFNDLTLKCDESSVSIEVLGCEMISLKLPKKIDPDSVRATIVNDTLSIACKKL